MLKCESNFGDSNPILNFFKTVHFIAGAFAAYSIKDYFLLLLFFF